MIHEMLGEGKENARTGRYFCDLLGISLRDFVAQVERERRQGAPICASQSEPQGYFLAADREEMEIYCRRLQKRAGELHKTRRACLRTLEKLPGAEEGST